LELLDSLEVRWFLEPESPTAAALSRWFGATEPEGKRTDHYLLTGRDDFGFKARIQENQPVKVEAKYLVGSHGAVQVAPDESGKLEHWRKISLALDDPRLKQQGSWLPIDKRRLLRKFAFERGTASEVPGNSFPDAGCNIELTELRYQALASGKSRLLWTFGFEAFGPETRLLDVLQAACRAALDKGLKLDVSEHLSMSYPEWLWREENSR
jgi:hypothetical protein